MATCGSSDDAISDWLELNMNCWPPGRAGGIGRTAEEEDGPPAAAAMG